MNIHRVKITIRGIVQGIGFRPFIYRLALEHHLNGWVINSSQGVFIEVEGEKTQIENFILNIDKKKPQKSYIQNLEYTYLEPVGYKNFEILQSDASGDNTTLILSDIATCSDCLTELFNPKDRRYLYPFINCTNCGPRFTIIKTLPYDRPNTTMSEFQMCDLCKQEYHDPQNRRFHAQPNACPVCGPQVYLWDNKGNTLKQQNEAIYETINLIKQGKIVAVKGIGGFHLVVDATNDKAVKELRVRKRREQKPFAMMYPSVDDIKQDCYVSDLEARLLLSAEAPIVFLKRLSATKNSISKYVVDEYNPYFGIMLPYSPLHHILLHFLKVPIVATSANISDEPICYDENEALIRLEGIADYFLVHNRKIQNPCDDSIVRIVKNKEFIIRRARGYAPLPIHQNKKFQKYLALGAHQKNTLAFSLENNLFITQHNGDLDSQESIKQYEKNLKFFTNVYSLDTVPIICDLHPDYTSTSYAHKLSANPIKIQHHIAHVYSCMFENQILDEPVLGVAFDGTGYGLDGTIWGGEFFLVNKDKIKRFATFKPFKLAGSSAAVKEPKRSALGLCFEAFEQQHHEIKKIFVPYIFNAKEYELLYKALLFNINSPLTSSVGRIFDAIAALLGLIQINNYEAQAAMYLEFKAHKSNTDQFYKFEIIPLQKNDCSYWIDISLMLKDIIVDKTKNISLEDIAKKFHNTIAQIVLKISQISGIQKVMLTGGCFQNKCLLETTIEILESHNFKVYWHQRIPTNDGGISAGQVVAAQLLYEQNQKES